jgi:hypothetical protein
MLFSASQRLTGAKEASGKSGELTLQTDDADGDSRK